jgi:hypothetical protein
VPEAVGEWFVRMCLVGASEQKIREYEKKKEAVNKGTPLYGPTEVR